MRQNKPKICEKCNGKMLLSYNTCPNCGYFKYKDGELEEFHKKAKELNLYRFKNPVIQHNVR